ncbi:discoidin domain-containing protein [Streptomyces sp. NPDC060198]|uniref:discoidin domain-containing protein n=1 Tax=Streptomyces sp. NPDC060198 TaxID=3347070 RepID=UPI00364E5512
MLPVAPCALAPHARVRALLTAVLTAVLVAAALAVPGPARAVTADPDFTLYDNTAYTSAALGGASVLSSFVPARICASLVADGALPGEAEWKSIVQSYNRSTDGPLVLDCETLYLNSTSTAADHYARLLQLQSWAREVAPGQVIGWYGLLNNTISANYGYYRNLIAADPDTAFFPSLYTYSAGEDAWNTALTADVAKARAVDADVPLLPYVWPQYHGGSSPSSLDYTFVPAAQWSVQLATIRELGLPGAVVWGGWPISETCDTACQAAVPSSGWLAATRSFLGDLADRRTDLARGAAATVSSVNVTGRDASKAVDGDPATRWGSTYADPQWITVDLGARYRVGGVRLVWETAYGRAYTVQVSDDASSWTTAYSTTSGAGGVERVEGLSATGRYVRVHGTARGTSYGYSLWSLEVYGTAVS